jgi:cytoskeletal protein RodZ
MTEEVTALLKRAREEKGLSAKDVEEKTRIPLHYLQILEGEGDPRLLADILYLVPFLRTYSAFLGLDPAATIAHFIGTVQKGDTAATSPPATSSRLGPQVLTVFALLAGAVALSVWWLARK